MKLTHREIALGTILHLLFSIERKFDDRKDLLQETCNILDHMGITDITLAELDDFVALFAQEVLPEIRLFIQSKLDLQQKKDLITK